MANQVKRGWRVGLAILVIALIIVGYALRQGVPAPTDDTGAARTASSSAVPSSTTATPVDTASSDAHLESLFAEELSDVAVTGSGTVLRVLADDTDGDAHQRFILELDSGLTLLIAHNIDIAPRLDGLGPSDRVGFHGEYVYSPAGGTIHWTHHDPQGTHEDGWLEWEGHRYD